MRQKEDAVFVAAEGIAATRALLRGTAAGWCQKEPTPQDDV